MSKDFKKVLVKDDRLNVSDQISYAVHKGGQNMSASQFNAITQSTSSCTWNIQVPSEQTMIDRRLIWSAQITLRISGTPVAGQRLVNYGLTDALSAFPLHQLASVMTATINNNTVSINMRDVLPSILRMNDKRQLSRYNGMTPVMYDTYRNYQDGVGAINNVLGGFENVADNDLYNRGTWVLDSITGNSQGDGATVKNVDCVFTVFEPVLLSPFIYADPASNNQALYGIQNLNFVFNFGSADRVWRSCPFFNGANVKTVSFTNIAQSKLLFNFITPHPSDVMPARNVVPFYEMPRYITQQKLNSAVNGEMNVITNSLQLNQIPDLLYIMVRKSMGEQKTSDADCWLPITKLAIQFNNQAGILSNATPNDLWRYSTENGCNQSYLEYAGYANQFDASTGNGHTIPTSGSHLVLAFGKDIQISEDFYASGSLGNFNLQINLTVKNNTGSALVDASYEIVLITQNSGVFVCERGTSSTFTGILTKQDVLDASEQEPYYHASVKRLVGGGFLDKLKSVAGNILPLLPKLGKEFLGNMDNKYAKAGASVLGALGAGRSGGKGRLADRLM
jgi:hypothetical protein